MSTSATLSTLKQTYMAPVHSTIGTQKFLCPSWWSTVSENHEDPAIHKQKVEGIRYGTTKMEKKQKTIASKKEW